MALTLKHLNSDASFLLSFEPVIPESLAGLVTPRPFTVLLDPWIIGPSTIIHPRLSTTSHKYPACISSLAELSQPPDLVIISQHKPDHCNEATLRQLPADGKTLILAEPASARVIRSWKYFDKKKVRTIERWEDPRITGKESVIRIPVPAFQPGTGQEGEITVAFIPQKRDLAGLHGAIGITYKAPDAHDLTKSVPLGKVLTPPSTPEAHMQQSANAEMKPPVKTPMGDTFLLPPTPPISPISPISPSSLRSIRSASTLIASPTLSLYSPIFRPSTSSQNEKALPPSAFSLSRPISVIFSPHGIQYSHLAHYATSHLVAEAALPLTALLHCMDSISSPWWLGGNICAGVPFGAEIASKLGARLWISAHDGEKDVRGLTTGFLKTFRWKDEEIESVLNSRVSRIGDGQTTGQGNNEEKTKGARKSSTEILRLKCGEEILVSGTGQLWRTITSYSENTQSNLDLTKKVIVPPPPKIQAAPTGSRHKRKQGKKTLEIPVLPKVQDGMSPKKLAIYKALRTIDLIKPSPKLVLEQHVTNSLVSTLQEPKCVPVQSALGTKTERVAEIAVVDSTMPKSDPSDALSTRFEIPT
ncbi:hypothetical protein ONZ43_g2616 [Nemania bipapillata]|uniref:Uncharacterized protein n=1 Tax=Nemania bipapillata TaxID=110536 RepID=A0ACC2IZY8_9PEZI|nr:hypothetical protein ONZ43_g2616 [Nemania bipapillata]